MRAAVRGLPDWIRANIPGLIATAIVSGVVGYAVNVWLMAVRYEGSVTPEGAPATSKDNVLAGGLFWAMFPMVACSAIGYRRAVGRERFWRDVRRLPMTLVGLFRRDGSQGWVHLLWGSAVALAATLLVPPAVGAVLGVGLLIGAPTIVGSVLSTAFGQLWRLVGRVVAPTKDHRVAPILKVAVGILGWALAFVVGFVLPGEWIRLVLALACGATAVVLGRRTATGAVAAAVVVALAGYVIVEVLTAAPALADDGGFAECGSTLEGWIRNCAGAGEIRRRAVIAAIIAAQFGALGFVFGGFVGLDALATGGGAWWDRLGFHELPRGPIDPATGEALVVNDGRWTDVPVGHVFFEGQWSHPEAVGAVPDLDEDPFSPDPLRSDVAPAAGDDPSLRPELWVPPLVGAAIATATRASTASSGRTSRSERAARQAAEEAAATMLADARAIHVELAAARTDEDRARLHAALRAKAVEIVADPTARLALAADTTGLGRALAGELDAVDTEVMGVFVERVNELGVTRGGRPVTSEDVGELRDRTTVSPGSLGKLWKGYGAKKGKFAVDAATYLRFLEDRRDDPQTGVDDRARYERKIERLRTLMDDEGVATVMVSEEIWNDVARFAYEQAYRATTGSAPPPL